MGNNISSPERASVSAAKRLRRYLPVPRNRLQDQEDQVPLLQDSPEKAPKDISLFLRIWAKYLYVEEGAIHSVEGLIYQDILVTNPVLEQNATKRIIHVVAYDRQKNKIVNLIVLKGMKEENESASQYYIYLKHPEQNYATLMEFTHPSDEQPAKEWLDDLLKYEFCAENIYIGVNTKSVRFRSDLIELGLDSYFNETTIDVYHVTEYNVLLDKILEVVVVKGAKDGSSSLTTLNCEDRRTGRTWSTDFDNWILAGQLEECPRAIRNTLVTLSQCSDILFKI